MEHPIGFSKLICTTILEMVRGMTLTSFEGSDVSFCLSGLGSALVRSV